MAKKTSERFRLHIDFFPMMDSGCHHFVPAKAPLVCPLSSHLPALITGTPPPHPLTPTHLIPPIQFEVKSFVSPLLKALLSPTKNAEYNLYFEITFQKLYQIKHKNMY